MSRAAWLQSLDGTLAVVTEMPAAALLLADVAVLSSGVFARYVLDKPFIWSDELAITLFLWLSMLGSVIAVRRGQHMRLGFVVSRLPPRWREVVEPAAMLFIIALLLEILSPSIAYAQSQWTMISPGVHLPETVRSAAVPVGVVLMIATLAVQMFERFKVRSLLPGFVALVAIGSLVAVLRPSLLALGNLNLLFFFVLLVMLFVAASIPIAFAFGLATFAYLGATTTVPLSIVVNRLTEGMADIILLSIPLFIFLGLLMEMTGLARALIQLMMDLLGHVRNGLSYVLLAGMYLVSGISGSKAADMAAIVPILFPEMKKQGRNEGQMISLLAASGAMAETIPPSIILITIGVVTGVSIAKLFNGGLLPAAVGAIALALVIFFRSRREALPVLPRASLPQILRAFVVAIPALILPFLIRGAVINGVATATEVATVGIVYCALCGIFIYRRFPVRSLYPILVSSASLCGAIMLIIGMATAMAWALTQSGFSAQLASAMTSMPGGKFGFMTMSIVVFAILGSVLEGFPAIVLFGPLLFPIARELGIHEVQYTMVVVLSMSLGLFSPPVGIGFYSACAVGQVSPDKAMKDIWVYMAALLLAVILVAAVPWLSTGFL